MTYISIFIGGGIGSVLRFALSRYNGVDSSTFFTWGTFAANIISCFILGLLLAYNQRVGLEENSRLLLITGLCGGFSTFSTFSYELLQYINKEAYLYGAIYLGISLVVSILFIILGLKVFNIFY